MPNFIPDISPPTCSKQLECLPSQLFWASLSCCRGMIHRRTYNSTERYHKETHFNKAHHRILWLLDLELELIRKSATPGTRTSSSHRACNVCAAARIYFGNTVHLRLRPAAKPPRGTPAVHGRVPQLAAGQFSPLRSAEFV